MILPLFNVFIGKQLIDVEDQIEALAKPRGYNVNILDPNFKSNIDVNYQRLNVHIDGNSVVRSFTIG